MLQHIAEANLYDSEHADPISYYKWPLTLIARGKKREAAQLISWINAHCLQANGDYLSNRSGFHKEFQLYATLWIVLAAIELSDTSLTDKLLGFVLKYHNSKTGGLATFPAESNNSTEDLCTTAFLGMAACSLKDKTLANNLLHYFELILELQDEEGTFWTRLKTDGSLAKNIPGDADLNTYVIAIGKENECYYFLGAACFFLARYIETFGNEALSLAHKYADVIEQVGNKALRTIWAAKVSPGCSALYTVTLDERFLKLAHPVLTTVLDLQAPGGYWLKEGKPWITVSSEQCFWLTEIYKRFSALT
ncbi:unnamed protein product [Ectocarpus sp. 12 AP-2014]